VLKGKADNQSVRLNQGQKVIESKAAGNPSSKKIKEIKGCQSPEQQKKEGDTPKEG